MVQLKNLILYSLIVLSLGGCLLSGLPSGIANNGCSSITGCTSKDFYQPGRGVWADDASLSKSKIGAGLGVVAGVLATHGSGDPLLISAAAVAGLVV